MNVSTRPWLPPIEMELDIKGMWETHEFEASLGCIGEHGLAAADSCACPPPPHLSREPRRVLQVLYPQILQP